MPDPWMLYDDLIETIPEQVTVTSGSIGLRWCRITSSDGGLGIAYTIPEQSRPPMFEESTFVGARLRDVARLVKSWNFAEAGIGLAAIGAWHNEPRRVAANGFAPSAADPWHLLFHPYRDLVAGRIVTVVGHFPFAPEPLSTAARLHMLERIPQAGDYPDPACEYLLPDSEVVFISASALVNKTMPRLLELSAQATTIVVGPTTPLATCLFDHGVDGIVGFVAHEPHVLAESLGGLTLAGMFDHGHRVELHRSVVGP